MTNATILKDGSKIQQGDIVRFWSGTYAIMRVDKIEDVWKQGKRLYGETLSGECFSAWACNCTKASAMDIACFRDATYDRRFEYSV